MWRVEIKYRALRDAPHPFALPDELSQMVLDQKSLTARDLANVAMAHRAGDVDTRHRRRLVRSWVRTKDAVLKIGRFLSEWSDAAYDHPMWETVFARLNALFRTFFLQICCKLIELRLHTL